MKPKKLTRGSHVRVIAPSRNMSIISSDTRDVAVNRLKEIGLSVSFGKNIEKKDAFISSSIADRLDDLHEAFSDPKVDAILTAIGGYNANQLLADIDYDLIKKNPKILCGYSDITVLSNAILAKTDLISYSGPHFSSFGMIRGFDYTLEFFMKCLFSDTPYEIKSSQEWSDDLWFLDQQNRNFTRNDGFNIIKSVEGEFEGRIIGPHLRCLNALQGTDYWPGLENTILFIEEDDEVSPQLFDRQLQSILHQNDAHGIQAIVIGRFQDKSQMTMDLLKKIICTKKELRNIPVIANVDFGHTTPFATFPIGGTVQLIINNDCAKITISNH